MLANAQTWQNRWNRLRADPKKTLERRLRRTARQPFESWGRRRLARTDCFKFLARRPKEAFAPDYTDLWFLYSLVRAQRPEVVFEYGCGCSTVVIAQALADNQKSSGQKGTIYSLETDARWAAVTRDSLPAALIGHVDLIDSALSIKAIGSTQAFVHQGTPTHVTPDFIYLDGPALTPEVPAAIDLLELEPQLKPGFAMVVDGRWDNVALLKRHSVRKYAIRKRWPHWNSYWRLVE